MELEQLKFLRRITFNLNIFVCVKIIKIKKKRNIFFLYQKKKKSQKCLILLVKNPKKILEILRKFKKKEK